jgi:hypothetical protein
VKHASGENAQGVRNDPALAPFRGLVEALGPGVPEECRGDDPLAGAEELVAALRALPALDVPAGFTENVIRALHHKRCFSLTMLKRHWRRIAAVAACLVLAAALAGGTVRRAAPETFARRAPEAAAFPDAETAPLAFLARTQRADGSWSDNGFAAPAWRARYGEGITSLALLAFLCRGEAALDGENGPTVRRGVECLIRGMDGDGTVGGERAGEGAFTQYLAAQALVRAAGLPGAPESWRDAAAKAAGRIPADAEARERLSAMNRALRAEDMAAWGRVGGPAFLAAVRALRG